MNHPSTEGPILYPPEMSDALRDVLGMHPGHVITFVGVMRQAGYAINTRYEDENAAVRHYMIPFAINYGNDWRRRALEHLTYLRETYKP